MYYICSMKQRQTVYFNTIEDYNRLYGLKNIHPLVSVVDLKVASQIMNHFTVHYGIYAIFLKNDARCAIRYGRRTYDCQEGSVVSFCPGQVVDVDIEQSEVSSDVIGLLFHPDILTGTPLADTIGSYSFFNYSQIEALHLSETERQKFHSILQLIREEINQPADHHSVSLLSSYIQIMLENLHRFYDRQFETRHAVDCDIVSQFQKQLNVYFDRESEKGLPAVSYFADKANLSPGYFGDLIKKETGSTAKSIISNVMLSKAKHRLISTTSTVSEIAYGLGFEYPAHFSRMFTRMTGQSPTSFRLQNCKCKQSNV